MTDFRDHLLNSGSPSIERVREGDFVGSLVNDDKAKNRRKSANGQME